MNESWLKFIQPIMDVNITPEHYRAFMAGAEAERKEVAALVEQMGMEGYGTLDIAAAIRKRGEHEQR